MWEVFVKLQFLKIISKKLFFKVYLGIGGQRHRQRHGVVVSKEV